MDKSLSILFLSSTDRIDDPGPVTKRLYRIANGLGKLNVDARILLSNHCNKSYLMWHKLYGKIPCAQIGPSKKNDIQKAWYEGFIWAKQEFSPNVVVCYGNNPLRWCRLIHDYCKLNNICIMGDYTEWYSFKNAPRGALLDRLFMKYGAHKFDGMIAISSFIRDKFIKNGIPVVRIPATYENIPEITEYQPFKPPVNITYIGRLAPRDIPLTLLKGFELALKSGLEGKLQIIGKPEYSKVYKKFIKIIKSSPQLHENIEMKGYLNEFDFDKAMKKTDIFVFPREDSQFVDACFPTRLPEMLPTGKPVIISDSGDLKEYFTHRKNIWFIPPGNYPEELGKALLYLYKNPEEAYEIGLNGLNAISEKFYSPIYAKQLIDFVQSLRAIQKIEKTNVSMCHCYTLPLNKSETF
jgi:glycosyltransferase involved in cell wall biosynthesis